MTVQYLKSAAHTAAPRGDDAPGVVARMLEEIERRHEPAVREYARRLDQWTGEIVLTPEEIEQRTRDVPADIRRDIELAAERVFRFALAQRHSIREFETEVAEGLFAGQKLVPVNIAVCYGHAGRF